MMLNRAVIKFSKSQLKEIEFIARKLNMNPSDLLKNAIRDCSLADQDSLSNEISKLSAELSELTSKHAPISSKLSALIFKYHEVYSACGAYIIALLGLEAENRTLCMSLNRSYDNSYRQKEEKLFDKYHMR